MKTWSELLIPPTTPILEAIQIIDAKARQIALVVDPVHTLLGTVTDGDIRRGILKGIPLQEPVEKIMNPKPTVAQINESRGSILEKMTRKKIYHIPVVDKNGRIVDLELYADLVQPRERKNWVVLMAGGLGKRLSPITDDCPKPLLPVGGKPLLEIILENLIEYGFRNFYFSVNYKAEMIKQHFQDSSKWGGNIRFIEEETPLGTAGALALLPEKPTDSLLVMNADLLTKVNFQHLLDFHHQNHSQATLCVREYDFQIPYGVVSVDHHRFVDVDEKPVQRFFVSAGIYLLEPEVLDEIPSDTFFDMPSLFKKLAREQNNVTVFPIREYWLDIGNLGDFERANNTFSENFK